MASLLSIWQRLIPYSLLLACTILCAMSAYSSAGETFVAKSQPTANSKPQTVSLAFREKKGHYTVRTKHLLANGQPKYSNQLIKENSPYLLQHAHNPVNWYAWGKQAFDIARTEHKPIFLSIGYSTCHWCHVMEEQSFDNPDVAAVLNEHFISIKVDREQRPDLDAIYMTGVQLLTGRGGWPMSNFLTPDGKPFYAGTYYPPQEFINLLRKLNTVWQTQEDKVIANAEELFRQIKTVMAAQGGDDTVDLRVFERVVAQILEQEDKTYGGFGEEPKFPNETILWLLLDDIQRNANLASLTYVERALAGMAQGGIYDQVGGGFHRYAVDKRWLVPHFEKMLYNQAQLARTYLRTFQLTHNPQWERIGRQTLDYVLRDMSSESGGFYSATDADSEGEEGTYFLWTAEQIKSLLPSVDAELAMALFGISKAGNFEGKNILNLPHSLSAFAKQHQLPMNTLQNKVNNIRETLYQARGKRIEPFKDKKIIVAWNAMMITSLANAGNILNEQRYINAGIKAAHFIWDKNYLSIAGNPAKKHLLRINLNGKASTNAGQEDYAYFCEALIHLYDITQDKQWLERAETIMQTMINDFWDTTDYGFFMAQDNTKLSPKNQTPLSIRSKSFTDNATASGNSVAFTALVMLNQRTENLSYKTKISQFLSAVSTSINKQPLAYSYLLPAVSEYLQGNINITQYAANGAIRIQTNLEQLSEDTFAFTMNVNTQEGWHINSNQPRQEQLIATEVYIDKPSQAWMIDQVNYPTGQRTPVSFQREPLDLYVGKIIIQGKIKHNSAQKNTSPVGAASIKLRLQACTDALCLPPEELSFNTLLFYPKS